MLKEKDVIEKGLMAFENCVSIVPSLKINSIEKMIDQEIPDYRISVQGQSFTQFILLEIKTLGTPKSIRQAVNSLSRQLQNDPMTYGVIVAPYISAKSDAICKEAGIGYVDLSGNCSIAFQQVYIRRENMANRYPFKTSLSSIYSPKSERILRVLLGYPYQVWKAVDLADEAQVSLGMITQVGKKLIEEEWLKKSSHGIALIQPESLLEDWTNHYTIRRNILNQYYSVKSLQNIEKDVADRCNTLNIPYALTGFSACNRLAPMVRGQRAMIYVSRDFDLVAENVGLKPVNSGANVILIQPYDDGVYWNGKLIDDLQIVDPVQAYLDVKKNPGRGEEAADFLLQEVINPRWQQQKKNMTVFS